MSFFGHLFRADARQDHSRALQACSFRLRASGATCAIHVDGHHSPNTGDAELVDQLTKTNLVENGCGRSAPTQFWPGGALWIDRHGVNSRRWPRPRDMLRRE